MDVSALYNTCSMCELGQVTLADFDNINSREEFEVWLSDNNDYSSAKTYICNVTSISIYDKLVKIGFKEVAAYYGNEDKTVYVMLLLPE